MKTDSQANQRILSVPSATAWRAKCVCFRQTLRIFLRRNRIVAMAGALVVFALSGTTPVFAVTRASSASRHPPAQRYGGANSSLRSFQDESETLKPGQSLTLGIEGPQVRPFSLPLTAGQLGRVIVTRRSIRLVISVFQPDGQKINGYENPAGEFGPVTVWISAQISGTYKVEVRPEDRWLVPGTFDIVFEPIQFPTEADQDSYSAAQVVAQARQSQLQDTALSRTEAIQKYKAALLLWQKVKNSYEEANTLHRLAQTYKSNGDIASAKEYYRQALALRESSHDKQSHAYTLNDLAAVHRDLGDANDARTTYELALQLFADQHNERGRAAALYGIGFAYALRQNWRDALEPFKAALAIYSAERNLYQEARILNTLAAGYDILGESSAALENFQSALKIWKEVSDPTQEANTISSMAKVYLDRGNWPTALELYDKAITIFDSIPNQHQTSLLQKKIVTLDSIGYLYILLGDPQRALKYFQQAHELCRESPQPWSKALTLARIGYANLLLGHLQEALDYCEQSRQIREETKDPLITESLTWIGMTHIALGNPQEALKVYRQALERHETLKSENLQAQAATLDKMGEALTLEGSYESALDTYQRALLLWRKIGDRNGETLTLFNLANTEFKQDHLQAANQWIESALDNMETLRSNTINQQLRTSYFATKTGLYELDIAIKMQLSRQSSANDFGEQALLANERLRARSLIDALAEARVDIRAGVDPQLIQLERTLQETLDAKAGLRIRLLAANKASKTQISELTTEIEQLTAKHNETQASIRWKSPHYAALIKPETLTVKRIQQQLLDDNTLLLEYSLGHTHSYVWAVTSDSIKWFELPEQKVIEETAIALARALTERNQRVENENPQQWRRRLNQADAEYARTTAALAKMVIEPVAALLGHKRLVIVADGALQSVPFGALTVARNVVVAEPGTLKPGTLRNKITRTNSRFLSDDHEIVYQPSASVLALQRHELESREPALHAVAVLADPVFDQADSRVRSVSRNGTSRGTAAGQRREIGPRSPGSSAVSATQPSVLKRALRDLGLERISWLPFSRTEANAIISVVPKGEGMAALGFEASRTTALSPVLSNYRIVHFATHGFVDFDHPDLSGILLSMVDEKGDPQDGYLRLHEIYNLNLPADLVVLSACQTGIGKQVKGEGLIALTRGFMYAGAKSVVASFWKVDDAATSELMAEFYKQMFTNKLKPAAALSAAQRNMSRQKRWQSPYYWAGFFIQGEWN